MLALPEGSPGVMFRKRSNRDALTRKPAGPSGPVVTVGIRPVRFFRAESQACQLVLLLTPWLPQVFTVVPHLAVECNQGTSKGLGQEKNLADNPRHERAECRGRIQGKCPREVPVSGPECMKCEVAQLLIAAQVYVDRRLLA